MECSGYWLSVVDCVHRTTKRAMASEKKSLNRQGRRQGILTAMSAKYAKAFGIVGLPETDLLTIPQAD
jgi:hypothetical protein